MAGHNKWSKIKRKKGAKDQARATLFSKASKSITAASRACHGDLSNLQLQSAIAYAKSIQLPKARIQDAIDKHHLDDKTRGDMLNLRYDAMIPFGGSGGSASQQQKVACLLTALTDNRNRTASNVRSAIHKFGGELLPTASLNYMFDQVGVVLLDNVRKDYNGDDDDEDALWEVALDCGATDVCVDNAESSAMITCNAPDLWSIVTILRDDGRFHITEFEQRYVPRDAELTVSLDEKGLVALESFLDVMDQDEDVAHVYHNAQVDD